MGDPTAELTPWYKSKQVWQNIILIVAGSCMLVADVLTQTPTLTLPGFFSLIAGICGVIFRVWFNQGPINVQKNRALIANQSGNTLEDKYPGAG